MGDSCIRAYDLMQLNIYCGLINVKLFCWFFSKSLSLKSILSATTNYVVIIGFCTIFPLFVRMARYTSCFV